jgi:TldD protein
MIAFIREVSPYILFKLMAGGGEYGEVFFEDSYLSVWKFENGKLETPISGRDTGVGIRLIKNLKTKYGYTSDFSKDNLLNIAGSLSKADGEGKIKIGIKYAKGFVPVKKDPEEIPLNIKKDILQRADDIARSYSPKIKQVKVLLKEHKRKILIINTEGEILEDTQIRVNFLVETVASDGFQLYRGYESVGGSIGYEIFDGDFVDIVDFVAMKSAERAVLGLKAKPAPTGQFPVVISSQAGGTMIHEAVGHGLEADLVYQNLSVYKDKIGSKVASDLVTVIDSGVEQGKNGFLNFDDEGVPAKKNILIENGILVGYMYDRLTALKTGKKPTGNGRRENFRHIPMVRMTNTYIAPGKDNPHDLVADTKKGIYVVKMGGGQVNTVNGDFIFEIIEGYMIENGKISYPLKGASLIGNGPKALMDIDGVGYDLGWAIGTCGKSGQGVPVGDAQPTIRIKKLTLGGTQ